MSLRAESIHHSYGEKTVFEDLSLMVTPGEVLAIIGPSGVGKSTLLRLLALFDAPDQGRIEFDDRDVWQLSRHQRLRYRRRIGMVFQEASLFNASVRRNAAYGLRVRQSWTARVRDELSSLRGGGQGKEAVIEALEAVGMAEKLEQEASSLSGGEAQRVAFARSLAYDPDVLLLDEPTSDLDPRNTAVIEAAIAEARDRGIGVVIATHDMHQAERVADRVAVLLGNSIIETDDATHIFENPTDERTQQFIRGELVY